VPYSCWFCAEGLVPADLQESQQLSWAHDNVLESFCCSFAQMLLGHPLQIGALETGKINQKTIWLLTKWLEM
jgi:hypothetical protein